MSSSKIYEYRFRVVRATLPPPERWVPYLADAYRIGWFTNFGPASRKFEAAAVERWGCADTTCILVSNATVGLAAPLIARRITGPVLCSAFTFPATHSAIRMAGCETVVMDSDPNTWLTDPATLDAALMATGARAVLLVTPFGLRYDLSKHVAVCRRHGALLVVDNASGLADVRDHIERDPDVFEVFSLHATKSFAIGEGGLICAHRSQDAALRSALNFGLQTYASVEGPDWGINGKCSEMHAAIALAVLDTWDEVLARRRTLAASYAAALTPFEGVQFIGDPNRAPWQLFPVVLPDKAAADVLVTSAAAQGVELRRYYRPCMSTWPGVRQYGDCTVSRSLADRTCCLPIYSEISASDFDELLSIILRCFHVALDDVTAI